MKPTVGRIVHFANPEGPDWEPIQVYAAIVARVLSNDPERAEPPVDLWIFAPGGILHSEAVPFSETQQRGYWSWPTWEGTP